MTKWDTHGARKASLQSHLFIPFVYPRHLFIRGVPQWGTPLGNFITK